MLGIIWFEDDFARVHGMRGLAMKSYAVQDGLEVAREEFPEERDFVEMGGHGRMRLSCESLVMFRVEALFGRRGSRLGLGFDFSLHPQTPNLVNCTATLQSPRSNNYTTI